MTSWRDIKGIYLIERNNKNIDDSSPVYYVGKSVGIFNRWRQHCVGTEQNIDRAINEFGSTSFTFSILEVVTKTKDLNEKETFLINKFKEKGEDQLFNISQTTNSNPYLIDNVTKNEIKELFQEDIGRSIYAIAEKYKIDFRDVVKLRKPLLMAKGLKYDSKLKNIVDSSGQFPSNWKGDVVTRSLGNKILELVKQDLDLEDISYECNISIVDLKKFITEYNNDETYDFANQLTEE